MTGRVLSDFMGSWRLSRIIHEADGTQARLEGMARWEPQGPGALYTERGTLQMGARGTFHSERRYLWGPGLEVSFEDGRFFHQVPDRGGAAWHWCAPDRYDVTYDFADWPIWTTTWKVAGPRKSYVMESRFSPD